MIGCSMTDYGNTTDGEDESDEYDAWDQEREMRGE